MEIKQITYRADEAPRDREILGRFKPNCWALRVMWNGNAWRVVGTERVLNDSDLVEWAEI